MKKSILFNVVGNKEWIGGLYYLRNIIYQVIQNDSIRNKFNICICVSEENKKLFSEFSDDAKIIVPKFKNIILNRIELLLISIKNNVFAVYVSRKFCRALKICGIAWIPDFQHKVLPEMFSGKEISVRNKLYSSLEKKKVPLVLSSQSAYNDYRRYFGEKKKNVYVVPFVSFIEPEIKELNKAFECEVLKKFSLENARYACVMNQFWKHKNHIVVLQALIKYFEANSSDDFRLVMTGLPKDYRNPEYMGIIEELLNNSIIQKHVFMLGFIERKEQLVIMKNAEYLIQPSLFEGWGTVVEDAKVLDKTILLSDIPIHREQMNDKCILFDPYDADQLAELMSEENKKEHVDCLEKGVQNMKKRAVEYSKEFERLLMELF